MDTTDTSLVNNSMAATRNVKTAKLAPVNGCDAGSGPSYRLLGGRARGKDLQKQEVTLPKLVSSRTSCRSSKAARLAQARVAELVTQGPKSSKVC